MVQTGDGYLLGLHRLGWKKGEEGTRVNAGQDSLHKKVVYLHHGLMMNSEVWVCLTEKERCLPFMLVENGYDVWVGYEKIGHREQVLTSDSLAITVATSTLRSRRDTLRIPTRSGTSRLTSSHFMIYRIVSTTFSRLPRNLLCHILAFLKVRHRHLPRSPFILR